MKNLKYVLAMVFLGILLQGCNKEEDVIPATSEIKVVNYSDYPFALSIEGDYKCEIRGNDTKTFTLDAGKTYYVRVLQKSGYMLYPSEYEWNVTTIEGKTHTLSFTD